MSAQPDVSSWLSTAVAVFGELCKQKLAGPGDPEAAIRSPLEALLATAGTQLGLAVVPHDEVRDTERGVRPDYAIRVDGAITGYVEVKRPGRSIDPTTFVGHDKRQWERQRDLPNLIYTNGTDWRLWRDGEPIGDPVELAGGSLETAGVALQASAGLEALLSQFLRWRPAPITSIGALVRAVAPLTRLLRGEVLDQLTLEDAAISAGSNLSNQPFHGLAHDWRALLFPEADDARFADGYAQTVTFALLLARSEEIDLNAPLHEIGDRLGEDHSLMGRALQLLTDTAAADFSVTLDLLRRVVGAVRWDRIRRGRRDTYLYLYEQFLDVYDAELRKASGSYYTPADLVGDMTRLAEEALVTRLGRTDGFLDPDVLTVDPAMGTGTFLNAVIDRAAASAIARDGEGAAAGIITDLAQRLVGFELQLGPFAVAELRASDLLRSYGASPPPGGMATYVTNTLDDPYVEVDQIASTLQVISASRRKANEIKGHTPVTVVIGNPPYREKAQGQGGWVEHGRPGATRAADRFVPLDDFKAPENGLNEYVLKNLAVYFWRWATWKVFDAHSDDRPGVVCFVTTSAYIRGRGFAGMREYLRRTCSEGWVIDLTPEGHRPAVNTRLFPGVQQTLAVGLFVRTAEVDPEVPAVIHHRQVHGRRADKLDELHTITLDGPGWREARTRWQAPLTPAASGSDWDEWPALNDLLPWGLPGIKPNKTWVYSPARTVLDTRWRTLVGEQDPARKKALFQEAGSTALDRFQDPLPGADVRDHEGAFADETASPPAPVQVGFRSFDRQWILPDSRLIERPRPTLWAARRPGQIYLAEQSAHAIDSGPGVILSSLIPDQHLFNGRGGRILPMRHPDGTSNTAPGLLEALAGLHGHPIVVEDLVAYITAVTAQPAYTTAFVDELTTPGVRVPITTSTALWDQAVGLGRNIGWAQTFGAAFADPAAGRPADNVRLSAEDPRRPLMRTPVTSMPETIEYDEDTETLRLGDGTWGPVSSAVWAYDVGGRQVLTSWFGYRKINPAGRRRATDSPLGLLHVDAWPSEWSGELIDVLTVLARLVELEQSQEQLLTSILAEPLADLASLTAKGVAWPTAKRDRLVRLPSTTAIGGEVQGLPFDGLARPE